MSIFDDDNNKIELTGDARRKKWLPDDYAQRQRAEDPKETGSIEKEKQQEEEKIMSDVGAPFYPSHDDTEDRQAPEDPKETDNIEKQKGEEKRNGD